MSNNQIASSVLNTVLATSGDLGTTGTGYTIITGLPAFPTSGVYSRQITTASVYTQAAAGSTAVNFYTLDTNMTLSASGVTMTWSSGTPDCILGLSLIHI